jgi:hypothetical protein
VRCSNVSPCRPPCVSGSFSVNAGHKGGGFSERWQGQFAGIFELSALSHVATSDDEDASAGGNPVRRLNRRNPTASSEATSSRRSSTDMAAGSSRCMGAPRPARTDASAGRAFAHNDLRSAAGELSGGNESSTLRVNSVLLHYLPRTSSKCLIRSVMSLRRRSGYFRVHQRRPIIAPAGVGCNAWFGGQLVKGDQPHNHYVRRISPQTF